MSHAIHKSRRPLLVALCLGLLIVALSALSAAAAVTTYYVDAATGLDTNDGLSAATAKLTIGAAVTAAADGDTIIVAAGTYAETVAVNKGVTIVGADPLTTIVDPPGTTGTVFNISASNVTLEAMTIQGQTIGVNVAGNTDNLTFENLRVVGHTFYGISLNNVYAATTDVEVIDSYFSGGSVGVRMASRSIVDGLHVEGSTFENQNLGVYESNEGNEGHISNLRVTDNTFTNLGLHGVYFEEGMNVEVDNNTFTGNFTGVYLFDAYDSTSQGGESDNINIHDNLFTDHKYAAVRVRGVGENGLGGSFTVHNNTFNQDVGTFNTGSPTVTVSPVIEVTLQNGFEHGTVNVTDNTIIFSGDFEPVTTAAYGVMVRGGVGTVNITGNTIGGGTPATTGVYVVSNHSLYGPLDATSVVNVSKNLINDLPDGVVVYDEVAAAYGGVPAGAQVNVTRNDLSDNTAYGIQSGATTAITGTCNWWGDASGPSGEGTGTGSAVSTHVNYTGWLFSNDLDSVNVTNTRTNKGYCSIQAAIDDPDTQNGDTLEVAPGTYHESVSVTKSLTINGANAGVSPNDATDPLLPNAARGPESVVTVTGGNRAFSIGAANVTINGFKFTNTGAAAADVQTPIIGAGGNFGGDAPGVQVLNNLFDATSRTAVYFNGSTIMQGGTVNDNRVANPVRPTPCLVNQCGHQLFNLWKTNNLTFERNVTFAPQAGEDRIRTLNISGSTNVTLADNTVRYTCNFTCFTIAADTSGDVTVTGNDLVTDAGNVLQIHNSWVTTGATINVHHNILETGADFPIAVDDLDADLDKVRFYRNAITGGFHARNGKDDFSTPGTETLDVTCNWWGSATGPDPTKFFGPVKYAGWLFSDDLDSVNVLNTRTNKGYCSIQAAIDDPDTQNGDTLEVAPGTYHESISVTKSLTINGANAGVSPNDATDPLQPNAARGPESVIHVTGTDRAFSAKTADVTIDGFKFTHGEVATIADIQKPLIGAGGNFGGAAPGLKVLNNLFVDTSRVLIYTNGPTLLVDGTIEDNRAEDPTRAAVCGTDPVAAELCDYALFNPWRIDGLSFQRNVAIMDPGTGDRVRTLNVAFSQDMTIADNTVRNACIYNCFKIAAVTSGDVEMTGNDLVTDVGNTIKFHESWTTTGATINVHHNILTTGANDYAILVNTGTADLDNVRIYRNAITGGKHVRNADHQTHAPGAETLDVTCNWWGSAAGPNPANFLGPADYTPWLFSADLDGDCYVPGTITVEKVTVDAPAGDTTQFTFDPSWGANFGLTDGQTHVSPQLQPGNYSVAELPAPANWSLTDATCVNDADANDTSDPDSIPLAGGESWTCTFTNTYTEPVGKLYISPNKKKGTIGGVAFTSGDILVNTIGTNDWAIHFDGSEVGLKTNLTDYVFLEGGPNDGCMLMTFAGNFRVSKTLLFKPHDVAMFCPTSLGFENTAGTWSMYFDGSDVGLSAGPEKIDGLAMTPDGDLIISTKGNFNLKPHTNMKGTKNELLVFSPNTLGEKNTTGTWGIYYSNPTIIPKKINPLSLDLLDGNLYMSIWTNKPVTLGGVSIDDNDIFYITPDNQIVKFWDGNDYQFKFRIMGLHIAYE